ncbi:sensor domain-containing diguanylate cyclase [Vibrio sp. T187]|uniref:sensor domain-containing diguanylate cyclase n=1 Tax=Vibrio TaxID=662 RepID=UPI0010C97A72|nr:MULTISPECIES: diguanylate cyclase [Vibrio]MBW3696211.1 sensor domain-containing diguanylate cyclase [Vibrio sp. T187]
MNIKIAKLSGQFLCTLFALGIVPALYVIAEFDRIDEQYNSSVQQANFNQIEYSYHELATIIRQISTSVPTIARSKTLIRAIEQPDPVHLESVQDLWTMLARGQKYYSQLRFLDNDGMERIRVNHENNITTVIAPSQLQDKSNRDYFAEALTLKPNQVISYGLDLEVEKGQIVTPIIPALRVITPVESNGKRLGYFIANLNMNEIYSRLKYERGNKSLPTLINKSGYVVMSQSLEKAYGHIIPERSKETLAITQPKLWESMLANDQGNYFDGESWFFYSDVSSAISQLNEPLYMVLNIKDSRLQSHYKSEMRSIYEQAAALLIIIMNISGAFVWWNYRHNKNSIESRLAKAAMNGMSALVITDRNNRIIQVNQEFTRASGYTLDDVKGKQPSIFASGRYNEEFYIQMWKVIQDKGIWEGEVVNKRKDGSLITEILRIQTIMDKEGVIQFYVASFVDISQRKELENRLRDLSEKDALAGCWNRRKFDNELRDHSTRCGRYPDKETSCLAILDIDHFKRINDKYGHDHGDKVIRTVAEVLQRESRETDFVARIGGEEFGLILPHTTTSEANYVLNRLRTVISLEFGEEVTISGGITNITADANQNYKCADVALYDAKASGRNTICLFLSDEIDEIA